MFNSLVLFIYFIFYMYMLKRARITRIMYLLPTKCVFYETTTKMDKYVISYYRSQLQWFPIIERRNLRILSAHYSLLTPYLKSKFNFLSNNHSWDLRSSQSLFPFLLTNLDLCLILSQSMPLDPTVYACTGMD